MLIDSAKDVLIKLEDELVLIRLRYDKINVDYVEDNAYLINTGKLAICNANKALESLFKYVNYQIFTLSKYKSTNLKNLYITNAFSYKYVNKDQFGIDADITF